MEWAQQRKANETKNITNKTKVDIYNDNSHKDNCGIKAEPAANLNNTEEAPPVISGTLPPK
jgi:hypothetical protein